MHELAIAQHLVRLVEDQASAAHAKHVIRVNVRLGEQSHVVTKTLASYFELLTASNGSSARGASLVVKRVPMRFFCKACELEYPIKTNDFACPLCQRTGQLTDPGDQLFLESLEVT